MRSLAGMRLSLDAIHIVGYVGAAGSLLFGSNQLRVILQHRSAKDVGVFDYGLRVGTRRFWGSTPSAPATRSSWW